MPFFLVLVFFFAMIAQSLFRKQCAVGFICDEAFKLACEMCGGCFVLFCRLLSFARPLLTFAAYASGDDGASKCSFYNDGYAAEGLPWRETVKLTCESYGGCSFVGCPFLFSRRHNFSFTIQFFVQ